MALRIDSARSDSSKMPPYNGEWQSFITLKLSGSLDGYNQLYLAAVNRRSVALDQLAAADRFLAQGDTAHTKSSWEKAVRLSIDSDNLARAANEYYSQGVSNTAAVLNAAYQISSKSAAALGYATCGRPCYDGIDVVTVLSDYAVDTAIQGKAAADQNLIKAAIIAVLLHWIGIKDIATAQVTHFVGQPDSVHVIIDQVLNQPQFKTQIMTALGRSSVYLTGVGLSAAADSMWQALSAINRDCSNISLSAPVVGKMKAANSAVTVQSATISAIRQVDFRNFRYPSGCSKADPGLGFPPIIPVVNGKWEKGAVGENYVSYGAAPPIYGKLLGGNEEQAVVSADCFLGNGDDEEIFVYGMTGAKPTLVQRLTISDWAPEGDSWRTTDIAVRNNRIVISYFSGGSHAQPAWTITTNLRWNGSKFVRAETVRKPFKS